MIGIYKSCLYQPVTQLLKSKFVVNANVHILVCTLIAHLKSNKKANFENKIKLLISNYMVRTNL